jgi:ubiquinone/menaquinone biosynthesis C-methylase UbiE
MPEALGSVVIPGSLSHRPGSNGVRTAWSPPVNDASRTKSDLQSFYASEALDRASEDWLAAGGSVRVPESPASHYFIDRKVETALAMANLPRESRVIEVGCSFGHMTFLLAERFREVLAVDLSPESIALARRRAEHYRVGNVRFEVADAERLETHATASFDGAFSFSTLRFCPHPERAVAELVRVTRSGGPVVADFPNRDCPWYGPLKRMIRVDPHIHDRLFSAAESRAMLASAGLRDVASRHILFTTKRIPAAALPLFRVVDRLLEAIPGVRRWSGIVMASGRRA